MDCNNGYAEKKQKNILIRNMFQMDSMLVGIAERLGVKRLCTHTCIYLRGLPTSHLPEEEFAFGSNNLRIKDYTHQKFDMVS